MLTEDVQKQESKCHQTPRGACGGAEAPKNNSSKSHRPPVRVSLAGWWGGRGGKSYFSKGHQPLARWVWRGGGRSVRGPGILASVLLEAMEFGLSPFGWEAGDFGLNLFC